MPLSELLPKVLISHSWKDKRETMIIADGLRELNCAHVWIDFENMNPGVDIDTELRNKIKKSDFLILVWTDNVLKSENVQQEIKWAVEYGVSVIPCYFQFDEQGDTSKALGEQLREITGKNLLWIEFRNHQTGIMELYSSLQAFENKRLTKEVKDSFAEKNEILRRMQGYNKYLINYRNVRDKGADRSSWINRIMNEVEVLKNSGNKELTDQFISGLYNLEKSDPEAFRVLKPKLDAYFSKKDNNTGEGLFNYSIPASVQQPFQYSGLENLRMNFHRTIEKEYTVAASISYLREKHTHLTDIDKTELIQNIINVTADGLNLLNQACVFAQQEGLLQHFLPVLDYVTSYYFETDDIRDDSLGLVGWVDDSYLCFSALQQINHIYYTKFGVLLINMDLNPYLQFLLQNMEREEIISLDQILTERISSIDWNAILTHLAGISMSNLAGANQPINNAGRQRSSWGGAWEDEMAERAARLGISWNY